MTDPAPKTRSKARAYAEDKLGVNAVWTDAQEAGEKLEELLEKLGTARQMRRHQETLITDRELELAEEERTKHADMSVAAMERHLKTLYHKDDYLRTAREGLRNWSDEVDELEFLRSAKEAQVRLLSARMIQLGGYLNYLAAVTSQPASTDTTREAGESQ